MDNDSNDMMDNLIRSLFRRQSLQYSGLPMHRYSVSRTVGKQLFILTSNKPIESTQYLSWLDSISDYCGEI